MPNDPNGLVTRLSRPDLVQLFYSIFELVDDDAASRATHYEQWANWLIQREKQLVKQQVEATWFVHTLRRRYTRR
jgi:hypothetical protein